MYVDWENLWDLKISNFGLFADKREIKSRVLCTNLIELIEGCLYKAYIQADCLVNPIDVDITVINYVLDKVLSNYTLTKEICLGLLRFITPQTRY